jgi:hypothetical protein
MALIWVARDDEVPFCTTAGTPKPVPSEREQRRHAAVAAPDDNLPKDVPWRSPGTP